MHVRGTSSESVAGVASGRSEAPLGESETVLKVGEDRHRIIHVDRTGVLRSTDPKVERSVQPWYETEWLLLLTRQVWSNRSVKHTRKREKKIVAP